VKLKETALYAEILSSIAVLLTLIFLVVELRDNTDVSKSLAYGRIASEMTDLRLTANSSELLAPVWERFIYAETEGMNRGDRMRMRALVLSLFSIYEDAYYSEQYGIMDTNEWNRFEGTICANYERLISARLTETVTFALTDEFVSYIEEDCN
jgi:hypothetical protein